jgi:hypothetical protein
MTQERFKVSVPQELGFRRAKKQQFKEEVAHSQRFIWRYEGRVLAARMKRQLWKAILDY